MAKLIDDLEFKRPGRQQRYPWETWTDGRARLLTKDEDFFCELISFRSTCHRKAQELGMRVIVELRSETDVALQFREN